MIVFFILGLLKYNERAFDFQSEMENNHSY